MAVVAVSWDMARDYCTWAGGRLPTESQWEYAARAGSSAARYGNLDSIAWFADNSGRRRIDATAIWYADPRLDSIQRLLFENGNGPHVVGQKEPNAWNLFDMLGNVRQWVEDWYAEDYYVRGVQQNPDGPSSGNERVLRGGSWYGGAILIRVSCRFAVGPDNRLNDVGFRCAAASFGALR
jgi:formylglycine-generating enzyme required for sulfatase activity